MHAQTVTKKIISSFSKKDLGRIFFPEDFSELGTDDAVRQALHRLDQNDILVRIAQGIYLYPKRDDMLGILYPTLDEVAQAIARRDKARIIPTGVQALNRLGLSTQVPMKVVYLTDGAPRDIQVGKNSIKFKRTTPKNLSVKGEISSLVIQALRELGQDGATGKQIEKILDLIVKEKPEHLKHDVRLAPAWIRKIMLQSTYTTQ